MWMIPDFLKRSKRKREKGYTDVLSAAPSRTSSTCERKSFEVFTRLGSLRHSLMRLRAFSHARPSKPLRKRDKWPAELTTSTHSSNATSLRSRILRLVNSTQTESGSTSIPSTSVGLELYGSSSSITDEKQRAIGCQCNEETSKKEKEDSGCQCSSLGSDEGDWNKTSKAYFLRAYFDLVPATEPTPVQWEPFMRRSSSMKALSNFFHHSNQPAKTSTKAEQTFYGCFYCDAMHPSLITLDEEAHIVCKPGNVLSRRYMVVQLIGIGTFGKVFECIDTRDQCARVAIKVIRNVPKYTNAATIEASIIRFVNRRDPSELHNCVQLITTFSHRNHYCLVFPLLGPNLYEFQKDNNGYPYSLYQIQCFGYQLFDSVKFLHNIGLTHTDLKPENILLTDGSYRIRTVNGRKTRVVDRVKIVVIDFGSATFNYEYHSKVVTTRHYRAPEVILRLGWSYPCDIWSLGCILVELHTGYIFFKTHESSEHLHLMNNYVGPMPTNMVNALKALKYDYPPHLKGRTSKRSGRSLQSIITTDDPISRNFRSLLYAVFKYEPLDRITAAAALEMPFFDDVRNQAF